MHTGGSLSQTPEVLQVCLKAPNRPNPVLYTYLSIRLVIRRTIAYAKHVSHAR